jgi:hypothetical protein
MRRRRATVNYYTYRTTSLLPPNYYKSNVNPKAKRVRPSTADTNLNVATWTKQVFIEIVTDFKKACNYVKCTALGPHFDNGQNYQNVDRMDLSGAI